MGTFMSLIASQAVSSAMQGNQQQRMPQQQSPAGYSVGSSDVQQMPMIQGLMKGAAIGGVDKIQSNNNGMSWLDKAGLILPLVSSALSLGSSIDGVEQDRKWANFEKKQQKADAWADWRVAEFNANQIRDKAKFQAEKLAASSAVAAANSGVLVGSDASDGIVKDLREVGEYDAQMTMYNANDTLQRALQKVKYNSIQQKQKRRASYWGVANNLISTLGVGLSVYDKWQKMSGGNNTSTAQSPSLPTSGTISQTA